MSLVFVGPFYMVVANAVGLCRPLRVPVMAAGLLASASYALCFLRLLSRFISLYSLFPLLQALAHTILDL